MIEVEVKNGRFTWKWTVKEELLEAEARRTGLTVQQLIMRMVEAALPLSREEMK